MSVDITIEAEFPSPYPTSQRPDDVEYDGNYLLVPEVNANKIYMLSPSTGAVRDSLGVSGSQHDIAWDGQNVWGVRFWQNTLSQYSVDGDELSRYDLRESMDQPTCLAYDRNSDVLWAINTNISENPTRLWKINAANGAVLDSIPVTSGLYYGMCMDYESSNYLWVVKGAHLVRYSILNETFDRDYNLRDYEVFVEKEIRLLKGVDHVGPNEFWLVEGDRIDTPIFKIKVHE